MLGIRHFAVFIILFLFVVCAHRPIENKLVKDAVVIVEENHHVSTGCFKEIIFYEVPGSDYTSYPGDSASPPEDTYLDKTYKNVLDTSPSGNYIGICTYVVPAKTIQFCSGIYNIDQYYDVNTTKTVITGKCPGSISLSEFWDPYVMHPIPITGGTGSFDGAAGAITYVSITDPKKCPMGATYCTLGKLQFTNK